MPARARGRLRVFLIAACVAAVLPLAGRARHVAAELRQERLAMAVYREGLAYQLGGRYDDAAAAFRRVVDLMPYAEDAYGSLADVEFRRGQIDAAVEAYRRLLAIYPYTYFGSLYRELGFMEIRAGRWADARADLERAVALDPRDWHAYYLLGHAHRRLGDLNAARAAWSRALAIRPDYRPVDEQLRLLDQ